MANKDIALMAHLMRRAGFGAPFQELEARAAKGYEATVEELLDPDSQPDMERDIMMRYQTQWVSQAGLESQQEEWAYRMINTTRPLQEKMSLFWHGILCTGHAKCEYPRQQQIEFNLFRTVGMGSFRDLLQGLAKDPAMVFYLDNCMSRKDSINENWGRELLELFSLGVGMDGHGELLPRMTLRSAARAFTGWTVTNAIPRDTPTANIRLSLYMTQSPTMTDEKTFLGETGNLEWRGHNKYHRQAAWHFSGSSPGISTISSSPTNLQVPAWQDTLRPGIPRRSKMLEDEYFRSNYDIRFHATGPVQLRLLQELPLRQGEESRPRLWQAPCGWWAISPSPKPGLNALDAMNMRYMGQDLLNPPTVEGWHTGKEWIDSGSLVERINFTADQVGNINHPRRPDHH